MKYVLKTEINSNGNEVLSTERRDGSFVYLAKDEKRRHKEVNKDWILRNKDSILNLHVTSANSIYYPLSMHKGNTACSCCPKWQTCRIGEILSKDIVNVSEYMWLSFVSKPYHFGKGRVVELPKVCAEKFARKLNLSYSDFITRMQNE